MKDHPWDTVRSFRDSVSYAQRSISCTPASAINQ